MPIKIDVTSTTSVDDAFDALEDSLGQVTVLVNNAGIRSDGLVAGLSDDEWDAAISTNLSSVFRTSRRALGPMIRARFGRFSPGGQSPEPAAIPPRKAEFWG